MSRFRAVLIHLRIASFRLIHYPLDTAVQPGHIKLPTKTLRIPEPGRRDLHPTVVRSDERIGSPRRCMNHPVAPTAEEFSKQIPARRPSGPFRVDLRSCPPAPAALVSPGLPETRSRKLWWRACSGRQPGWRSPHPMVSANSNPRPTRANNRRRPERPRQTSKSPTAVRASNAYLAKPRYGTGTHLPT